MSTEPEQNARELQSADILALLHSRVKEAKETRERVWSCSLKLLFRVNRGYTKQAISSPRFLVFKGF